MLDSRYTAEDYRIFLTEGSERKLREIDVGFSLVLSWYHVPGPKVPAW